MRRIKKKIISVGVIGLGFMGSAISASIAKEGFHLTGFDIARERMDMLVGRGGEAASSSGEVADNVDVILTSLPSLIAFEDVIWGKRGILSSKRKGLIVMECSTLSVEDKRKAHDDMQKSGMILLDCPISGGIRAAEKDLVVYGSGNQDAYEKCLPVINGFARANYYLGEFGNGTKMKILANLLVAIHNVSSAEAMVLGMKAGLDPELIYQVMNDSSGRSRMLEVRGPRMVRNDYENPSMKVKVFQKDLKIIESFASQLNCPTPLFASCIQVYLGAMAMGFEDKDTASVCAVLEDWAHLKRNNRKKRK
jgi:3-hydroxyisobutyrate dehydrogenase-like beta-hydroxyacid dehydrogenase